jgi:hypothetical protein
MKGYKASYNQKCMNDFYYEVGKTYEFKGRPIPTLQGFHFCSNPDEVFFHYHYSHDFVLFEVEAVGHIEKYRTIRETTILCTDKIRIERIIPANEYNDIFKVNKFEFDENKNVILYRRGDYRLFEFDERGNLLHVDRSKRTV